MKVSRLKFCNKEKTNTMKRILLVLAAAVLFLNTLVIPNAAFADGGAGGTSCGAKLCKP
jgi:hypothetical protein